MEDPLYRKMIRAVVFLLICVGSQPLFAQTPSFKRGLSLYEKHCSACHQKDGNGVTRLIPPLVGTTYVSGDKNRLIRILLNGINEPIVVQDEEYYSPMAAFSHLSDGSIADVLTYIRKQFGSGAGPVTPTEVRLERKRLQK